MSGAGRDMTSVARTQVGSRQGHCRTTGLCVGRCNSVDTSTGAFDNAVEVQFSSDSTMVFLQPASARNARGTDTRPDVLAV